MSGRGKGGKGLGKGGAKRHRKVLRDNIQGEHSLPLYLVMQWLHIEPHKAILRLLLICTWSVYCYC
jgi:hypothetical protein